MFSKIMNRRSFLIGLLASPSVILLAPSDSRADIPSIQLEAKTVGPQGKIEIKIYVKHRGRNAFHHVNSVTLFADGSNIKQWNYSRNNLPPSENFSVSHILNLDKETVISASANCNLHGANKDRGDLKVAPEA